MRVLFIGEKPESVDFSDPALPPGLSIEKIHAGIAQGMREMADRGWQAELCLIDPDDSGAAVVKQTLTAQGYDVVVIGGGIRVPPKRLPLFETLINVIHKAAPKAAIAFNTAPENTPQAAARWIPG